MKKLLFIAAAFAFVSCGKPTLIGTWTEPSTGQGIKFEEDGKIKAINMPGIEYQKWSTQNDSLSIQCVSDMGMIVGQIDLQVKIELLTADTLKLARDGAVIMTLVREK